MNMQCLCKTTNNLQEFFLRANHQFSCVFHFFPFSTAHVNKIYLQTLCHRVWKLRRVRIRTHTNTPNLKIEHKTAK